MGILSGIFKARDKPTNATAGSAYRFLFGNSTSGKAVTERSAMQMTAVYSCVRILAEAVAGLPLHLYRYTDTGGKEKAIDHPLYALLHDEPNPEMTSFVFRETLMTHLLLWDNAYAQIIRNGKGEVVALYPLMPNRMVVDCDEHGQLYYTYYRGQDEAIRNKDTAVILQPSDVLHIPGLGFDGLVGYSPIAMAKNAIGMAIACEEYGAKFFANGATPGGILEHPGTIKDPQRVRESWQSTFGGSGNANKVAVLEEGMKYTPISISPEQAQFLETRKFQINEIARIFRIPPHMVGDLEKSNFSNIEQQSLEFVKYTLEPWLVRWEQSMIRALVSHSEKAAYFIKFNVDGLLRGDYQSRMNGYSIGRQNGWMSTNDIRELENLDRIPAEEGGAAVSAIMTIVQTLIDNLPLLVEAAVQLVVSLVEGIGSALPQLIPAAVQAIITIVQGLIENLPMILDAALQLIMGLAEGLLTAIPILIEALPSIILAIVDFVIRAIPQIIDAGIQLLTSLVSALPEIITTIVAAIPEIIGSIVNALINSIPQIVQAGVQLLISLIKNLPTIIVEIVKAVPQIIAGLVSAFGKGVSQLADVGANLVRGLWQGIQSLASWLWNKVSSWISSIWDGICDFFGIASPSKEMGWVGEMLVEGLAGAINANGKDAVEAAEGMADDINSVMNGLAKDMETSIPTDFSLDAGAANALTESSADSRSTVMDGMYGSLVTVQQMVVRSEDDIRKVSQELYNLMQTGSRAHGRVLTA